MMNKVMMKMEDEEDNEEIFICLNLNSLVN